MASIKFDGTEILNTTYIPRFIKHESATERSLETLELAREDGSILISDKRNKKLITLQGILTAASQAALETSIDNFKELFSRKQKNLDITWANGTRRYVATCTKHNFDRDHFHLLYVPWSAEFVVLSGTGESTTEENVKSDSFGGLYQSHPYQTTVTLGGSAESQKIRYSITVGGIQVYGIELKNTDTGEKIIVLNHTNLDEKTVEINTNSKTVKIGDVPVKYYGIFPSFKVGVNNIQLSAGDIVDQQFVPSNNDDNLSYALRGSYKLAQSFMIPYRETSYSGFGFHASKYGSPGQLVSRIETDNNGSPSGTLANPNATATIYGYELAGETTPTWQKFYFDADFELDSNKRYWLVFSSSTSDDANHYKFYYSEGVDATYKLGNLAWYNSGWEQEPNYDLKFKILYGGRFPGAGVKPQNFNIYQKKRYI